MRRNSIYEGEMDEGWHCNSFSSIYFRGISLLKQRYLGFQLMFCLIKVFRYLIKGEENRLKTSIFIHLICALSGFLSWIYLSQYINTVSQTADEWYPFPLSQEDVWWHAKFYLLFMLYKYNVKKYLICAVALKFSGFETCHEK